jgi:branched-chain amino acid transport system substrate-binding protein
MVLAAANSCAAVGRLFITSGATSPHLPEQVPTYLYLACFGDNVQAAAAAEYAYRQLDARGATVIYRRNDTFTELLQGYFTARFTELGGTSYAAGSYESLDELSRVMSDAPAADLVFFSAAPDDAIEGIERMRQAGVNSPVLGGDSFDLGETWGEHPALSGIHFTTHAYVDSGHPDPAMATFIEAYAQAYPGHGAGAFAALGYDTARLIMAAVTEAGSADPAAVLAALPRAGEFNGLTGTISYENGSRIPTKSVTLLRVDGGRVMLDAQFAPLSVPAP